MQNKLYHVFGASMVRAALIISVANMPALAQAQNADTGVSALEEIIVSAERRSESVQSVPIAITALDSDALDSLQITELQNLKVITPNVVIEDVPGISSSVKLTLRGVGTDNPVFSSDSGVGLYVDDVFIARALAANLELVDIDRVEVLRGPQGTLYGRNSSAGALKIQTANPVLDENILLGQIGFGNEGQQEVKGALNAPIIEGKLAARIAMFSSSHDNLQRNLLDGSGSNDKNVHGGRVKLLWDAAPNLNVLLSADFVRERALPNTGVSFRDEDYDFDGVTDYVYDGSLYTYESRLSDIFQDADNMGVMGRVEWDISDKLTLTSISGYRDLEVSVRAEVDGLAVSRFEPHQRLDNSQFSQEFNLSGTHDRINWISGVYYFEEENDFLWDLTVFGNNGAPQSFQLFNQETEAYAAYGQMTYDLTDRVSLAGGVRYTKETKDFDADGFIKTGPQAIRGGTPSGSPAFSFSDDLSFNHTSYRLAADFAVSDDALLYASYSTGYRSGGFNGGARSLAEVSALPFDEETVDTAEIGLKSTWIDGRVRVNAAYFMSDFENLQEASLRASDGFSTDTDDAEISGVEIEASAHIIDGFIIGAQMGTLDSELDSTGNRVKNTPELSYTLSASYEREVSSGGTFFASGSWSYEDSYFTNVDNQAEVVIPEHDNLDLKIGYRFPNDRWEVELAAKNVLEEEYPTHGFFLDIPPPPNGPGPLSRVKFPNKPRMVMLRIKFEM